MDNNVFLFIICIISIIYAIYIIIYEQRSIKSKIIEDVIKVSGFKNYNSKEKNIQKEINKRLDSQEKPFILPKIPFKTKIEKHQLKKMDYYIFNNNDQKTKVFYLHGGSYFNQPLFLHFQFCDNLAHKLNCQVIIPIYPKTPYYDHKYSQKIVLALYKKLFTKNDKIILMGDSAGGGFCLSLYYLLLSNNFTLPNKTILLSPWLDVSMTNLNIQPLEKKDPQLSSLSLKEMGKLWAGNDSVFDPLVSPLYGNVTNLKNVFLFVGTHEIMLPDCRQFKNKCLKAKVNLGYYEYKNMDHVFILQPIPEAKKAFNEIIKIIKNEKSN